MDRVTLFAPALTRRDLMKTGVAAAAGLVAAGSLPRSLLGLAEAQSLTAMSLQLGWFANAQMAGDFTAIGKGYFKDVGIETRIVPGGPAIDPVGVVVSGSVPIGNVASIGVLVSGRAQGLPLKAFATALQRHPFAFFYLRGSGIRTPADFAGKNIGIQATARPLLAAVLAKYKIPQDKVNVVIVGGTTTPLLTKQVDVITGWVINYAQNLPLVGRADYFTLWDLGIRMYAYTYFTTDNFYNTRKDVLVRYTSAAAKGWQYAREHPEEAVDYVLRAASGLEKAMEIPTWKATIPYLNSITTKRMGWGYMEPTVWDNLATTYHQLEQTPRLVKAAEVMTNEIVLAAKTPKY